MAEIFLCCSRHCFSSSIAITSLPRGKKNWIMPTAVNKKLSVTFSTLCSIHQNIPDSFIVRPPSGLRNCLSQPVKHPCMVSPFLPKMHTYYTRKGWVKWNLKIQGLSRKKKLADLLQTLFRLFMIYDFINLRRSYISFISARCLEENSPSYTASNESWK